MYDFSLILVKPISTTEVSVINKSDYLFIDKGAHGAVFKISEDKCVKIFGDNLHCELEKKAYAAAQASIIVPRIYETGENYIVMDYIDGSSLENYLLRKKTISTHIAKQMIFIIKEMQRLGFARQDFSLRHILVNKNKELKLIDLVHAYTEKEPRPSKLFNGLKKQDLVLSFMREVKQIDRELYRNWKIAMAEYL